jgi:hypothetical protein
MTTNATDDTIAGERPSRYGELTIGDEEFVIYDRENHQAWLQSNVAVTAVDRR